METFSIDSQIRHLQIQDRRERVMWMGIFLIVTMLGMIAIISYDIYKAAHRPYVCEGFIWEGGPFRGSKVPFNAELSEEQYTKVMADRKNIFEGRCVR